MYSDDASNTSCCIMMKQLQLQYCCTAVGHYPSWCYCLWLEEGPGYVGGAPAPVAPLQVRLPLALVTEVPELDKERVTRVTRGPRTTR